MNYRFVGESLAPANPLLIAIATQRAFSLLLGSDKLASAG